MWILSVFLQLQVGDRWTSWSSMTWRRSTSCPELASRWLSTTRHQQPSQVYGDELRINWWSNQFLLNCWSTGWWLSLSDPGSASAVELVLLLVQTGLFDSALSLSRIFKLDLSPIFDALAFKWVHRKTCSLCLLFSPCLITCPVVYLSRCIQLQSGGEEPQSEAWSWLAANQLSVVNTKESRCVVVNNLGLGDMTEKHVTICVWYRSILIIIDEFFLF